MKKALFIALLLVAAIAEAQDLEYDILFEGIGDNREYSEPLATPQTILGARAAFELGVSFDEHKLRGGLSYLFEFGTEINAHIPKLTLYYEFEDPNKLFIFGAFPRRELINYPLAMLTDTLLYYRPNVEGFLGKVRWKWGFQDAFVDWVGRQTEEQKEQFMVGSSGEIFYKNLFLQNYFIMFHDAHTLYNDPPTHIEDYLGYALQAGIRTNPEALIQGDFKAGVLGSTYEERHSGEGKISATSLFAEINGKYTNFGIKSVLSSGEGHNFAYGDSFYQADDYWRTDVIWYFINHEKVKGRFNISLHVVNWDYLDQQQQLSIVYQFGR